MKCYLIAVVLYDICTAMAARLGKRANLVFEDGVGALHEQRLDQVTPVLLDGHV